MGDQSKLAKAVETVISAGYQMDREAFEFLSQAPTDPLLTVTLALKKIDELEEKPLFIKKNILEATLQQPETEAVFELQSQTPAQKGELENPEPPEATALTSSPYTPFAKDVESDIRVVEDSTGKFTSNGTMDEYLAYFQDRFRRMEKLLRQRMDVKAATPISEALKSPPKTKLKIIGMVTEKRDAKQQLLLTVEDLQASATVLVPSKASEELQRKAQVLLPDQVACFAVLKTRSHLFLTEDIIFPEIGQKPQRRAREPVYAVLTSDIHAGSAKFNKDMFKRFVFWLKGEYGDAAMREIASHVKYVLIAGDLVDGIGVFPGQAKELVVRDVYRQYAYASKLIGRLPDYVEVVVCPGNHDVPRKALPQPAISEDFLSCNQRSRRIVSLANPCTVSLHGVEVLMYHGRSLDDIVGAVPGADHQHPERAMKLLLQGRHLAPIYGGKTMLSPESRDYLVIDHVPDIFHAGHVHVNGCCNYRGVLVVNSGGWQEQTEYMAKLGLVPTPGKVPVVNLQTLEINVLDFSG